MNSVNFIRRQTLKLTLLIATLLIQSAMGADDFYRRIAQPQLDGASWQDEITVSPAELVRLFGLPTPEPWDSESLGAFYFEGADGKEFDVYFRSYDNSTSSMSRLRRSFWSSEETVEMHIGAKEKSGVPEFKKWLLNKTERR